MTAKEKAVELVDRFKIGDVVVEKRGTNQIVNINAYAKLFALRAVDEIVKSKPHEWDGCDYYSMEDYWKQVLIEINKLC